MSFENFSFDDKLLSSIKHAGYEEPTPIQKEVIPQILAQKDVIASAQTGTGKTAAFLLPIIQLLLQKGKRGKNPTVLVLSPTRELALQITNECEKYTKNIPFIKKTCVFGGVPFPMQKRAFSKPVDIVIATPGRLLDILQKRYLTLANIDILVLDEADRMLDMGFIDDVQELASKCKKERQTLLFSATMDRTILSLSKDLQKDPVSIFVKPDVNRTSSIEQKLFFVDNIEHKFQLLEHLLETNDLGQSIIFSSTRILCSKIAKILNEKGHKAEALHGDMSQNKRTKTFQRLKQGKTKFLVATDVASRGLDIHLLSHVINFDIPRNAEDYIHRIGRTGRAGASGIAITYASYQEKPIIAKIEKVIGKPLQYEKIEGLEPKGKSSYSEKKKRGFGGRKSFSKGKKNSSFGKFQRARGKFSKKQ